MSHFERVDVERRELSNVCWLSNGAQDITTDSLGQRNASVIPPREHIGQKINIERRQEERRRRRRQRRRRLVSFGRGLPHFCGFNTLVFALSFPSVSPPLSRLRLRLVIFRACSMFRSAAPTYCALFLALSHIYTHTYSRTISLNPLKPPLYPFVSFSPRRSRFLPLSYRALLLRSVAIRWKRKVLRKRADSGQEIRAVIRGQTYICGKTRHYHINFQRRVSSSPGRRALDSTSVTTRAYSFPARFPTTKSRSLIPNWILPVRISNSRTRYGGASRCESLVRSSRARIPPSPLAPLPRVRSYFYFAYPSRFPHFAFASRDCYYPSYPRCLRPVANVSIPE